MDKKKIQSIFSLVLALLLTWNISGADKIAAALTELDAGAAVVAANTEGEAKNLEVQPAPANTQLGVDQAAANLDFSELGKHLQDASELTDSAQTLAEKITAKEKQYESDKTDLQENKANQVLLNFLKQANGRYQDKDEVKILVEPQLATEILANISSDTVDEAKLQTHASRMTAERRKSEKNLAANSQENLIAALKSANLHFELGKERLYFLLNGFTVTCDFATAKKIAAFQGVACVDIMHQYRMTPSMQNSVKIINAPQVWRDYGYKGEGMVVAVIDSGIDPEHEVMHLTDPSKAKLTRADVEKVINDLDIRTNEGYFNEKVPFAMALALDNVKEVNRVSHGMHVAGTIAGNYEGKDRVFKGVAPEAQIIAFNVFNFLGGTNSELYLTALDYAYALRADAINMSIGKSVGTEAGVDPAVSKALKKLASIGTVVAISAGNDGIAGYSLKNPAADNMDFGVVADPSLVSESLSVAAMENSKLTSKALEISSGNGDFVLPYKDSDNSENFTLPVGAKVVFAGKGYSEDYAKVDVSDKIVLVERGEISFGEKADNALASVPKSKPAPKMIIFYNNVSDSANSVSMSSSRLVGVSIGKADGEKLKAAIESDADLTLKISGVEQTFDNPQAGAISDFSSWGPTPNYGMKPEITAPGGRIVSSINSENGKSYYSDMSGTSMSSPHVTGAVALLKQKLMEERNLSNKFGETPDAAVMVELKNDIKNILMSTARPHVNPVTGAMTSPRQQGAGILDILAAVKSEAYLYNPQETERVSKINLHDIGDQVDFAAAIHNFGKRTLKYNVTYTVQTDLIKNGYNTLTPKNLLKGEAGTVTVDAGSDATVNISFNLANNPEVKAYLASLPQGGHIDGFVIFTPDDKSGPELSMPFMGFYGSWLRLPMAEKSIYELKKSNTLPSWQEFSNEDGNAFTHLYTKDYDRFNNIFKRVLGAKDNFDAQNVDYNLLADDKIAISPNGDGAGDTAFLCTNMFRNYQIEIQILNDKGEVIERPDLGPAVFGTKNYKYSRVSTSSSFWRWDGDVLINDEYKKVADGKYIFRAVLRPDVVPEMFGLNSIDEVPAQNYDFPIYVDTQAPEILKVSRNGRQVTVEAADKGVGIMSYEFVYQSKAISSEDGTVTLPEDWNYEQVSVLVKDWALNVTSDLLVNVDDYANAKGSVGVTYTFKDRLRARRIDLSFKNTANGKIYYNANKLPLGTYEVYTNNLPYEIQLEPRMQTVTLTEEKPHADISFIVRDEDVSLGYVFLRVKKPASYFGRLRPFVIDKDGKRVLLQLINEDKMTGSETYRAKTLFGQYHLIFEDLNPGFIAYPNEMDIEVREDKDADVNAVIIRGGQFGKITPHLINEAGASEEEIAKIEWTAWNVDKELNISKFDQVLYGNYVVELKNLPQNTYVSPSKQEITIDGDNPEVNVTMTLKSNVGTAASLKIVNNFDTPKDGANVGKELKADFELKDTSGKVYSDYEKLPYGTYELKIKNFPPAYAPEEYFSNEYEEFLPKVRKIVLDEEHQQVEEVYNWRYLPDVQKEGNLYIRPIMNRSDMKEIFHFKITNSRGEAKIYTYAAKGYFTDAITLPYDTYTIEAVNMKKGIAAEPKTMQIALTCPYHIVRFTYKKQGEIEKYPQPTSGPGSIKVKMPVDQYYPYVPTLALYDYHNKLIAKTDFDMDLLAMEAKLELIPEGDYLLRIEDCGEDYVPIPKNVPISIRNNPYESYYPFTDMNVYSLYQQPIISEGDVPEGISYKAYAKLGDFEQTFGILKAANGQFTKVPEGHEYFIQPQNVPDGYAVYPPVQRVNYIPRFVEGVPIEKPEIKFEYFKLTNGVNTKLLERAMTEAKLAVDAEEAGNVPSAAENVSEFVTAAAAASSLTDSTENTQLTASENNTVVGKENAARYSSKDDNDTALDPLNETVLYNSATDTTETEATTVARTTETAVTESDSKERIKDRTLQDFIIPQVKDAILQDTGKVYLSKDYLAYTKNGKNFKGYYIPYGEFKQLYDTIVGKLNSNAYSKQTDVEADYAAIRFAVSHIQKKRLSKQARQVLRSEYDQPLEKGDSYVRVFVYAHPLWGEDYHWNMRLVDYSGREYFGELESGKRGLTYMFKNLPRGEYSLQFFNDNDMINLPQEWHCSVSGNKDSFEFINAYIRPYIAYPLQAIVFDPNAAEEAYNFHALPYADTHYDIKYNLDRMNFKISDLEQGPEGREAILDYFGDSGWDYIIDRDISDGCRIDFIKTAPMFENFRIYPKQVPAGYRVVNFSETRGITDEREAKAIKFYYVKDDRKEPVPTEEVFIEGEKKDEPEIITTSIESESTTTEDSLPTVSEDASASESQYRGGNSFILPTKLPDGVQSDITLPTELNRVIADNKSANGNVIKNAVVKTGEQSVSVWWFSIALLLAVFTLRNLHKERQH